MFTRVLTIWTVILALNSFVCAEDDKAKRDRDAAATLALELALKKPAVVASPVPVPAEGGAKVMLAYCIGDRCFVVKYLSPDAEEKEVKAAWEEVAEKARKATKVDSPLDDWSISAEVDPETGGVFAMADAVPPGWTCDESGCHKLPAITFERPDNCTCGETCPCVATMPPVSAGSPLTFVSYATSVDRPRLFGAEGAVRRVIRMPFRVVGRIFRR